MVTLTPAQLAILNALTDHPWLTPNQLEVYLGRSPTRLHVDLESLLAGRSIQRVNPRSATLAVRAVYALTDRGVQVLAERAGMEPRVWRAQHRISRTRHMQLLWVLDRVCRVRDLLLALSQERQQLTELAVEVEERFYDWTKEHVLHLHGRGMLCNTEGQRLPVVVAWETEASALTLPQLNAFVLWQFASQFLGPEGERYDPQLLFIVPRLERIMELQRLLLRLCTRDGIKGMPPLYLTTVPLLQARGAQSPIWFNFLTSEWGRMFAGAVFQRIPDGVFSPIRASGAQHFGKIGTFRTEALGLVANRSYAELLQFKLQLSPQAKRLLGEMSMHPLLAADELTLLLQAGADRVQMELKRLTTWKLVSVHTKGGGRHYTLTWLGLRYLTAEAGYGRAVQAYVRQRGLRGGTGRLVFHFQHTRVTNQFFLLWIQAARAQGAAFLWEAELPSQRYFRERDELYWNETVRIHRFMPDGTGSWRAGDHLFQFAVEIDRTHESTGNLVNKFKEYYAWQRWREQEWQDRRTIHLLVVTTGWARSATIREALQRAWTLGTPQLSLWVTTFQEIDWNGLDASIWRYSGDWPQLHRLPCFEELPAEPDIERGPKDGDDFQD